jgi:hypothetical protein
MVNKHHCELRLLSLSYRHLHGDHRTFLIRPPGAGDMKEATFGADDFNEIVVGML